MNKQDACNLLISEVKKIIDVECILISASYNPQQVQFRVEGSFSINNPLSLNELHKLMKGFDYSPSKLKIPNRMRVVKNYKNSTLPSA